MFDNFLNNDEGFNTSFFQNLNSLRQQNREFLYETNLSENIETVISLLDLQYQIGLQFIPFAGLTNYEDSIQSIVLATFHKNLLSLYSSIQLTVDGLYGSGRVLLRYVFESLMISKFCALNHDTRVFNEWSKGNTIYFTNMILKKIEKPNVEQFKEFWGILNDLAHFTKRSQQLSLNVQNLSNFKEVYWNLSIHRIFLECNYHLINAFFINTSSIRHFTSLYSEVDKINSLKTQIKDTLSNSRKEMSPTAKKFARNYTLKWTIKSSN